MLEKPSDLTPESRIEQLEKENFDLRQLLEISKSLSSNLDYSSLLDSILYICMGQMRVTQAAVFSSVDLEVKQLKMMRNLEGFELDSRENYIIRTNQPLSGFLVEHPKCFTIQELEDNVEDEENLQVLRSLNPTLVIPLIMKNVLLGLIILGERIDGSDHSGKEKEYLLNIANIASTAINNAVLFEMSTTDLMTRLKQKHYFFAILENRLQQSTEDGEPISLIMADIDHFKKVNDTFGHQVGDEVLKAVSSIIYDNLRLNDIGSRYGGEEFIILVQNAEEQEAFEIAERLRKKVESYDHSTVGCNRPVSISLGVTGFIPEDDSAATLIGKVDKALYYSKQNGRNRSTRYSEIT